MGGRIVCYEYWPNYFKTYLALLGLIMNSIRISIFLIIVILLFFFIDGSYARNNVIVYNYCCVFRNALCYINFTDFIGPACRESRYDGEQYPFFFKLFLQIPLPAIDMSKRTSICKHVFRPEHWFFIISLLILQAEMVRMNLPRCLCECWLKLRVLVQRCSFQVCW